MRDKHLRRVKRRLSKAAKQELEGMKPVRTDEEFEKLLQKEAEDDYPYLDCPEIWPWETTEPWSGLPDEWLFF